MAGAIRYGSPVEASTGNFDPAGITSLRNFVPAGELQKYEAHRPLNWTGGFLPVCIAQDATAKLLQELASRMILDLFSTFISEEMEFSGIPDVFVMPPVSSKRTIARMVRKEPVEFRFIDD